MIQLCIFNFGVEIYRKYEKIENIKHLQLGIDQSIQRLTFNSLILQL